MKTARKIKIIGPLLIVLPLFFNGTAGSEDSKVEQLLKKKDEIASLREIVRERRELAESMRSRLQPYMEELKNEIIGERRRSAFKTYDEASSIPRIKFNMKILMRLFAYSNGLDKKAFRLKNAENELTYYYRLVDDDIRIFEAVKDMDIDGLLERSDKVLKKYRPESSGKLLRLEDIPVVDPKTVWNYVANN